MVAYASEAYAPERSLHHLEGMNVIAPFPVSKKKKYIVSRREFRRAAEPSVTEIEVLLQFAKRLVKLALSDGSVFRNVKIFNLRKRRDSRVRGIHGVLTFVFPRPFQLGNKFH